MKLILHFKDAFRNSLQSITKTHYHFSLYQKEKIALYFSIFKCFQNVLTFIQKVKKKKNFFIDIFIEEYALYIKNFKISETTVKINFP